MTNVVHLHTYTTHWTHFLLMIAKLLLIHKKYLFRDYATSDAAHGYNINWYYLSGRKNCLFITYSNLNGMVLPPNEYHVITLSLTLCEKLQARKNHWGLQHSPVNFTKFHMLVLKCYSDQ